MHFFTAFPDDWLAGTAELSAEETGCFWNLCCYYMLKDGAVPDNNQLLARICKVSTRRWRGIRERLIGGGYIEIREGFIWQSKCEDRLEKDGNFAQTQRDKSKKRWGQNRANSLNGHNSAHAGAYAGGDPSPTPTPTKNIHTVDGDGSAGESAPIVQPDDFEIFWRTYPSRGPHSNPKKPAREKFARAVKRGIDPAAIIRGAEVYAETIRHQGTAPQFVAQAQTWLNQERWAECQRAPEPPKTRSKEFVP